MKHFFTKLFILVKRQFNQPAYILMMLLLLGLSIGYTFVPETEKSAYIPVALLCHDDNPDSKALVNELVNAYSVFTFYTVADEEEMYEDIVSGKASIGYVIPEGFMDSCAKLTEIEKIEVYESSASMLTSLASDEIFCHFFRIANPYIIKSQVATHPEFSNFKPEYVDADITMYYNNYIHSNTIFSIEDVSNTTYSDITKTKKLNIPTRKIIAYFIMTAALFGISAYIQDSENNILIRMTKSEQISFKLMTICSAVVPMSLIGYICILITSSTENAFSSFIRVTIYSLALIAIVFLISFIIRKSTLYNKVLPVYLILALIFGGVMFDLSSYSDIVKGISMLFPTYYF